MSVKLDNPNITSDPKEVIREAADFLEKNPNVWGQGKWIVAEIPRSSGMFNRREFDDDNYFYDANKDINACTIGGVCEVCLEGALLLFSADQSTYAQAKSIVEEYLNGAVPLEFNDRNGTDVTDVVYALRKSIK